MNNKPSTGPLQGIRILDLTRLYPGPLGTMMMADMGADVIKVEDVNAPDYMRYYPPYLEKESAGFLAVNRSKRSLAVNLRAPKGVDIFLQLAKTADIVIEQFRPGVLDGLGIGYEAAKQVKPDIIYVSITGYGQDGPYASEAAHDINFIGLAGILASTGTGASGPVLPAPQLGDVAGGAYMSVIACLSALWSREKTGRGQRVDVSMLDGVLPLMTLQMAHYQATKLNMGPGEQPLSGGLACYGAYECADGKYIALGLLEVKFWKLFCDLACRPDWQDKHMVMGDEADRLRAEIAELFLTHTQDEWIAAAKNMDVCLTPVLNIAEMENDPQLQARRMIYEQDHPACGKLKSIGVPLKFSETPAHPSGPAPALGEHTKDILQEIGCTLEDMEVLYRESIILIPGIKV